MNNLLPFQIYATRRLNSHKRPEVQVLFDYADWLKLMPLVATFVEVSTTATSNCFRKDGD
jgi:hypothetical protein